MSGRRRGGKGCRGHDSQAISLVPESSKGNLLEVYMNLHERLQNEMSELVNRAVARRTGILDCRSNNDYKGAEELLGAAFYQPWYTESFAVIRQLLPHRLSEFEKLYLGNEKRTQFNRLSYTIQDWMLKRRAPFVTASRKEFDDFTIALLHFNNQIEILKSATIRFESALSDIRRLTQGDLFASELDQSRELAKNGFIRAAGVVAGVVLERHLKEVAEEHNLATKKKRPTGGDYNTLLTDHSILNSAESLRIGWLLEIRHRCAHDKNIEPTREEVERLIAGVDEVTRTLS